MGKKKEKKKKKYIDKGTIRQCMMLCEIHDSIQLGEGEQRRLLLAVTFEIGLQEHVRFLADGMGRRTF
jgi:hypothetical protein